MEMGWSEGIGKVKFQDNKDKKNWPRARKDVGKVTYQLGTIVVTCFVGHSYFFYVLRMI